MNLNNGDEIRSTTRGLNTEIKIDVDEWPVIRDAISSMIEGCKI